MEKENVMTKLELIAEIAEKTDTTKKSAEAMLNAFVDTVTEQLAKGGKVQLIGFGTFEVRERKARTGTNPRTGEPIKIADSKVPAFKAGVILKKRINQ